MNEAAGGVSVTDGRRMSDGEMQVVARAWAKVPGGPAIRHVNPLGFPLPFAHRREYAHEQYRETRLPGPGRGRPSRRFQTIPTFVVTVDCSASSWRSATPPQAAARITASIVTS